MQTKPNPIMPWIVCISCGLFFFYEFIQMNMINSMAGELMQTFQVGSGELGLLIGSYFNANLIFLLPAALILDRFSTKKLVLLTLGICILGNALFASSTNVHWASVFRFFTGIGSAFCWLSCIRLASVWFHGKPLALIAGLLMTMAFLGGTVAQAPMAFLVHQFGWRSAVYIDAALGVLIFLIIVIIVKDYPDHATELKDKREAQLREIGFWKSVQHAYLNWQNWFSGICANFTNLPVFIFGASFGSLFLVQVQGFSTAQAATINAMLYIGTLIGTPVTGWFSDRIENRKIPIFGGTLIALLLVLIILYVNHLSYATMAILFLLLGFVTSAGILNYAFVAEKNPHSITATSVSVVSVNVIGVGGSVMIPIVGWLLNKDWSGMMVNGVRIYSLNNYHKAFLLLPIGLIISLLLVFLMKESHAKQVD